MKKYDEALKDAEQCVKLNPTWAKGYTRKAAALHGQGDLIGAHDTYEKALSIDPSNSQAKSGLESVKNEIEREAQADGFSGKDTGFDLLGDPNVVSKLQSNPKTAEYMKDPEFVKQLKDLSKNPMAALQTASKDPRLMQAVAVALGLDSPEDAPMPDAPPASSEPETTSKTSSKVEPVEEKEPAPEPDSEDTEKLKLKEQADQAKAEGNTLYKSRKFDEAIEKYNKAWELYKDITYLNNRAAAEFEKGDYQTTIETCKEAIEYGRENFSDFKLMAKAFARAANAYSKLGDLPSAIEYYNKSLTEHRTPDVLAKLRATEKELKKKEAEAYIDPELAEKAREEGNAFFKKANWPEAVKLYTEAIKRAPEDPRGYSNRAAAYLKLMSFPEAVRDCDTAISKDPKFFKAFTRKATALLAMREYTKCIECLDEAREIDTEHRHTAEIDDIYSKALSARFQAQEGETSEQTLERVSRDPEIAGILQDPVMNSILQQSQGNPAALRDHMKNPEVRKKINLLIAAGVIRTR